MKQHKYLTDDGNFDYEKYRSTQEAGNIKKLRSQWVDEETIKFLSDFIARDVGIPKFGLCHGTRRGLEQQWFAKHLPGCEVIGTEISSTATQFPMTVQWDFHDTNAEWVGRADFVYTNAWDHSYDPVKSFSAWLRQLAIGGVLLLEHTREHVGVTELDPFGATIGDLKDLLGTLVDDKFMMLPDLVHPFGVRTSAGKIMPTMYVVTKRIR